MPGDRQFDPERVIRVLNTHEVLYVLVGGSAAVLHGANYATNDIDVCPSTDRENLDRLSVALTELNARLRVVDKRAEREETFDFSHSGESLGRATVWNLLTDAGEVDLTIMPSATGGYDDLAPRAKTLDLGEGVTVRIASLGDIIRSKRAANRDKDRQALPILERMWDEFGDE